MTIKTILLFILATIWIEYNSVPIFPLGFLLLSFVFRPKRYLPFIVAMVLGLIGTGISFQLFHSVKINPITKSEHEFSKFLFGFNLGTKNITRFFRRDTIRLYQDEVYNKEQKQLDKFFRKILVDYNEKSQSFLESNLLFKKMRNEYGKIEDMYYFGNMEYFIPDIQKSDIMFVYRIKFVNSSKEQTVHFHTIVQDNGGIIIANIEVKESGTPYDIKCRTVRTTN